MLQRLWRQLLPAQHPPNLPRPRRPVQLLNRRHRAPTGLALLHAVMMIRERRDLRQVRDAQHLVGAANETRVVEFTPGQFAQLQISNLRLWWPIQAGTPNLCHLNQSSE